MCEEDQNSKRCTTTNRFGNMYLLWRSFVVYMNLYWSHLQKAKKKKKKRKQYKGRTHFLDKKNEKFHGFFCRPLYFGVAMIGTANYYKCIYK